MRISNSPDFTGVPFQPFDDTIENWNLGDVDPGAVAVVYVQFRDAAGNVGDEGFAQHDTILYAADLRRSGPTRIETGVDISQGSYGDDEAEVVVLARADEFADALAGTPFAVQKGGPMLLTYPDSLHPNTAAELQRVLPEGRTVYLLGGVVALSQAVEDQVRALGYDVVRLQGPSRVETAVDIAEEMSGLQNVLITTGYNFPDALAAGAAAAHINGAVLLTTAEARHPATDAFLDDHADLDAFAVGGPAARPYTDATGIFGPHARRPRSRSPTSSSRGCSSSASRAATTSPTR